MADVELTVDNTNRGLPPAGQLSTRQILLVMSGVLLGMLLSSLDQTIVGTAMPEVIADLNGLEHYAWVFTAYMLASTVMVPIYGKLSDIYGRRPFFLGGMIVFLIGSALSGMSQSMTQLILFRAIQGLGAGAMMPIAIAIIGDIFTPAERGKWQGLTMSVFGLSTIVGPVLGGYLTDNWGWRWVFYVNMPVGALAITVAWLTLPRASHFARHAIDYYGAMTLVAGTVPLLLAFSWAGSQYAWASAQIIALLVLSVVMLGVFFVIESRVSEPIINPALFRNSIFTISAVASFLTAAGMFGATLYLPLFIQAVIGKSATNSGAVLTPMMLGFVVSSIIGGQLMSRTGRYKILALSGFAVATVGMFLLSRMTVDTSNGVIVRNMVITGLGIGISMSLFTIVVQNAFPFRLLGQVTANLQFFRSIGGTIGIAILGTVMTNQFHSQFDSSLSPDIRARLTPEQIAGLRNPQALVSPDATESIRQSLSQFGAQGDQMFNQIVLTIRQSLSGAITDLFVVGMIAMVLAFVFVIFLKEIPLRKSHHEEGALAVGTEIASATPEIPARPNFAPVHMQSSGSDRPGD
jgi:EmrB/QacA subfamily drug resistance transporter